MSTTSEDIKATIDHFDSSNLPLLKKVTLSLSELKNAGLSLPKILDSIQYDCVKSLAEEMDILLGYLRPPRSTFLRQRLIVDEITKSLFLRLGTIAIPVGVTPFCTSLSGEKIQVTIVLPSVNVDPKRLRERSEGEWRLKIHEAIGATEKFSQELQSIQIHCEKNSVSVTFEIDEVEILLNDASSIYFSALIEDIEEVVGVHASQAPGIIQTSVFLIDSWLKKDLLKTGASISSSNLNSHVCR
jgi:hypothetical protein